MNALISNALMFNDMTNNYRSKLIKTARNETEYVKLRKVDDFARSHQRAH
jgi:hypothetical protein